MSYQQRIDVGAGRLLNFGCMDIKGEHYGSFDRLFWHLRQRDFSSSTAQMATLPLLKSKYAQNEEVRDFLMASLRYLAKIQHSDGSFDEWYPNERGWGGPTSYILDFLARTFIEYGHTFDSKTNDSVIATIKNASRFTIQSWEKDVLYNHVALSVLALEAVSKIDSKIVTEAEVESSHLWLEKHFESVEGWGQEYGAADPGYQTATLSFLSKAHSINPRRVYEQICNDSLRFIESFHFPDGSYAHGIGARETSCVFDFGAHYWKEESKVASALAHSLKTRECGLEENTLDDHYYVYRLLELGDCIRFDGTVVNMSPSSIEFIGRKYLDRAGVLIMGSPDKYTVINLAKGGAIIEYDKKTKSCLMMDYGVLIKNESGISTSFANGLSEVDVSDNGLIVIESKLVRVKSQTFSVFKNIIFRMVMLSMGGHAKIAYLLKHFIRKKITTRFEVSGHVLLRKITLSHNEITEVKDELKGKTQSDVVYSRGAIESRYVPQSKYHSEKKLTHLPRMSK